MSRIHEAMERARKETGRTRPQPVADIPAKTEPLSPPQPAYERIVQAILADSEPTRARVVLVVSATRAEGASRVARELARMRSRSPVNRTLLIDANLRRPSQHEAFGVEQTVGLSEVIGREVSLKDALKTQRGSDPSLLTSGNPTDDPQQLLNSPAFTELLEAARSSFDWVVIDGPPATAHPESELLAGLADRTILVLRAERTRWEVAERAKTILEASGGRLLGAVLNRRKYHIPGWVYRWL